MSNILLSEIFFVLPIAVAFAFMAGATYPAQGSWRSSERRNTVFCTIFLILWLLAVVGFIVAGLAGAVFIRQALYWLIGALLIAVSGYFIIGAPFVVDDEVGKVPQSASGR